MKHEVIDYFNLAHPQKRIWYMDKINFNSPLHNIGGCLRINETINAEIMKETLNIIIENNEGLRLRFFEKDGQPFQYVSNFIKENIDFIDFSSYENSREKQIIWA